MVPFLVSKFGKPTLSNLVKECFGSDFPDVFRKDQIDYIYRYLEDLKTESVLLEFDYVDKDYLEDYARYYVKRFSSDGHKCARLHFFSTEVDHRKLENLLSGANDGNFTKTLQDSYLGFMVIKPLPKTFIGKTCLKRYESITKKTGTKRSLGRNYKVDLFGVPLEVDSIAFQEQDKVVSACATTAIWSSLHALNWRNVRDIPACSEITTHAINYIHGSSNSFPNKELSNKQIMRALDVEQLRHHNQVLASTSQEDFLNSVRYHIDSQLPLILGVDVYSIENEKNLKKLAGHAVTVLGYKNAGEDSAIYIHDDRLGPFARATFVSLTRYEIQDDESSARKVAKPWGLVLQQKNDEGEWKSAHEVLVPDSLIMPTHQKVRLPFAFAKNTCSLIVDEFENWLSKQAESKGNEVIKYKNQLSFTLALAEISDLRQELIKHRWNQIFTDFDGQNYNVREEDIKNLTKRKTEFLTKSYARFQWIASFTFKSTPTFKVLFDATDIPQGDAVTAIFIEDKTSAELVLSLFERYAAAGTSITEPQNENFFGSFLKSLRKPAEGLSEHLNTTYGELRAPSYLKGDEISGGKVNNNESLRIFYEAVDESLDDLFSKTLIPDDPKSFMIWAIAQDGALLIGKEIGDRGHPSLTGFKPARIAGELRKTSKGWEINSKSGRYSKDYSNANQLLNNAAKRFETIFYNSRGCVKARPFSS